ncbi:MAG TPA: hypothetical protein VF719_04685 [Abditibacteriaceae bacterium]|jgi:4-amino-4-deoxy-L-arabinose transferase-like glycosyltransferase
METHPILRLVLSLCGLIASAVLGFFLYIFFNFYFDEMHIISTDYQLRPGLTMTQVVRDVVLTCTVVGSITGGILGVLCLAGTQLNASRRLKERTKLAFELAIACWLVMNAGVVIAAIQYVAHVPQRFRNSFSQTAVQQHTASNLPHLRVQTRRPDAVSST